VVTVLGSLVCGVSCLCYVQYGMSMSVLLRWEVGTGLMFAVAIAVVEMNSVEGMQWVTSS